MLSGVLLHVVKTPRPVNLSSDMFRSDGLVEDMQDLIVLFEDMDNLSPIDPTPIGRLSSGLRIEESLIQDDCRRLLMSQTLDDFSFEFRPVRFFQVEPRCCSLHQLLLFREIIEEINSIPSAHPVKLILQQREFSGSV